MSIGHLLKSVKQHPDIVALGNDVLEQGRIASFAVDLAHWLSGEPLQSLGLLARLILMVIHEELDEVRTLCTGRPRVAITAAAQITSELWPELQGHESATVLERAAPATSAPFWSCSGSAASLTCPSYYDSPSVSKRPPRAAPSTSHRLHEPS